MNFRRALDSVVTRLLLLGLCLMAVGVGLRYYAVPHYLLEDLSKVVKQQQLALAEYVAKDVDDKIVQRRAYLEHLAVSLPAKLIRQPPRLRAWLETHYAYQPLFSAGLFVVNAEGIAVADYPVLPGRVNTSYADRGYIQAALRGGSVVGRPLIGRAAKEPVLPIAAPIRGENNGVDGALVGVTALRAPGFLDSLLRTQIGGTKGGLLLISPKDRLFVASSRPDMVLRPTPPPGVNALLDRAMAGYRGTGITVNAEGIEEVSAMASVPSTGWFVVARLPSAVAFATVDRVKDFLLKGSAATILVFALLVPLGLYLVFRPLFRAAAHADKMTLGEAPLESLPVARNDEVGHLISAFNRLLGKLNDNQVELSRIAHHDELTGLPNRALLYDRLRQALAQAQRRNTKVALLFMDLDGFKQINDSLGHKSGDEVLRQVTKRFVSILRQTDTLARVGGDEFILLLSDLWKEAERAADVVAAKCIDALKAPFSISGTECTVGVSVGIVLGEGFDSADALLLSADKAMYSAKKSGGGRYMATLTHPQETDT